MYAKFEGSVALPNMKTLIEKCLNRMGLSFVTVDYYVKKSGEPRAGEHGTAFVDGGSRPRPTIFLEDRPLLTSSTSVVSFANRSQSISTEASHKEEQVTSKRGAPNSPDKVRTADSNPMIRREQYTLSQSVSAPASKSMGPADTRYGNLPISSMDGFQYVTSRPDAHTAGARMIQRQGRWIRISAEEWEQGMKSGKTVLICNRLKVFTEP